MDTESVKITTEYQPQKRLLSRLIRREYPIPTEEERPDWKEENANFLGKLFIWWVYPVLKVGYTRTITPRDIYKFPDRLKASVLFEKFEFNLREVLEENKKKLQQSDIEFNENDYESQKKLWSQHTVLKAMFRTFKKDFIVASIYGSFAIIMMSIVPILSKHLIQAVEEVHYHEAHFGKGIGFSFGSCLFIVVSALFINHSLLRGMIIGTEVKGILTTAILKKSFKLSERSKKRYTSGKITSLMGTDLSRVDMSITFQPLGLALPFGLIIAIVVLLVNIGVAALIGIGVVILFLGIIGGATAKTMSYRDSTTKLTDVRVDYIKEIVHSLKMIKFYSWEDAYNNTIVKARSAEIMGVLKLQGLRNVITGVAMALPGLASMVSFLSSYGIYKKTKGPAAIFSSVSSFEMLSTFLFFLPMTLAAAVDVLNAFKRVEKFLATEEIHQSSNFHKTTTDSAIAIKVSNATFSWDTSTFEDDDDLTEKEKKKKAKKKLSDVKSEAKKKNKTKTSQPLESVATVEDEKKINIEQPKFSLSDVNMEIAKGKFVVITGLIGSGKSSLLQALSGNMKLDSGTVLVDGASILCGEPWVQNATIRDNIIFGKPFDKEKYNKVVDCCALRKDFEAFEAGDMTEIGERGVTLSGGQKARVNLARAVYEDADIIFLDDVLSAVDARVGRHIVHMCLTGYLASKTRVLATHQLSLIQYADFIYFLNKDGTIDSGTIDELNIRNSEFKSLAMLHHSAESNLEDDKNTFDQISLKKTYSCEVLSDDVSSSSSLNERGKLYAREERAVNRMSFKIVLTYFKEGTGKMTVVGFFIIFFTIIALAAFCQIFTNTWLSFWISHKFPSRADSFYMGLYAMFTILTVLLLIVEFFLLVYVTTTSSKNLNLKAIKKILYAPMRFIDTTPSGRILNRFTKDTDALDNEITENIRMLFYTAGQIVGVIVLSIIYIPWVAIAVPVLFVVALVIVNFFQASTREIRRLEAVQRSFIYNNFTESLNGMETIKSYGKIDYFIDQNLQAIDTTNEAAILVFANQRWLNILLECFVFFFQLAVSLCCVCGVFNINPASTGLLVSYVFNLGGEVSNFIRVLTLVENDLNSAERLYHYAFNIDQEKPYLINSTEPSPQWPEFGEVKFQNVNLRYRPELPLVLKDLSFTAKAGEKIGICGRTGAGKSSIMTALFRLVELESGQIFIDGVDTTPLGLHTLRKNMVIIPQDPVLFNGTVRRNLDPFGLYTDGEILEALIRANVIDDEKSQDKFNLDNVVENQGTNFSLGEKQLLSFARALLRKTKILILDEATSSVDYKTDAKIQHTLATEFKECTILCIAHRLKTIVNYDKILVLEQGTLSESGSPKFLYNSFGLFRQMCEKANITLEDFERD